MSKSRRKANGCKRGTFKQKRMGKGWLAARKPKSIPNPTAPPPKEFREDSESESESESGEKAGSND